MERELVGKRPTFRPFRRRANFYRILLWLGLILLGTWLLLSLQRGQLRQPFMPTPTPTRTSQSYFLEAKAHFDAGKLDDPDPPAPTPPSPDAIDAFQRALELDPNNGLAWAELARIQAYSSSLLRNDAERTIRLAEAKRSADRAVELAPDESTVRAIRAFVLDWYAFTLPNERRVEILAEAESEALRAYNLDTDNSLALAFYAEILVDQQKWNQARQYAEQAVFLNENSMDTHRAYAYVLESWGEYNSAIQQYKRAAEITPNLTFLYLQIGKLYREGIKNPDLALEYFARAAEINEQLGVQNPNPFIEIARTYTQLGEFFIAARNAEKALDLDPTNAITYAQLGSIFIRARNYEGAMPLLKCAVQGCTATENVRGAVTPLELSNLTVAYYYVDYGTVLAFLSRPNENFCPEARGVLAQVRTAYPEDPILIEIVNDSEGICRRLEGGTADTPAAAATSTPPAAANQASP